MPLIDNFPQGRKEFSVYCINDQKLRLRLSMQFTKERFLAMIEVFDCFRINFNILMIFLFQEDNKHGLSRTVPVQMDEHLKEKSKYKICFPIEYKLFFLCFLF
jgi:hypothetical protein